MINKKIIFSSRITLGDTIPPTVPTNLYASDTVLNNLTWTASSDNITIPSNIVYYVERADDASFTTNLVVVKNWTGGTSELDSQVPTLTLGNTYYYRIKARDEALNESNWSPNLSSTIASSGLTSINLSTGGSTTSIACGLAADTEYFTDGDTLAPNIGDTISTDSGGTPFDGGNLWYKYNNSNILARIGIDSIVSDTHICP